MTAARLPMITVLMGPVATAAAAASFCTVNIAGARIPALTLCRRRLHDVTQAAVRLVHRCRPPIYWTPYLLV
jgi:hypothetical protein